MGKLATLALLCVLSLSAQYQPPGGSGGGSTSPGSPANSVQFNNAGAFGGAASLFWDATNQGLLNGGYSPTALAALNTALFDQLRFIGVGDGSAGEGSIGVYSGGGSNGALYLITSGGTFASPTDTVNGAGLGYIQTLYRHGNAWAFGPLALDVSIQDVATGESTIAIDGIGVTSDPLNHVSIGTTAPSSIVTTDANNFIVSGPAGITKTCASAITAMTVVNGIITSLTCP